MIKDERQKNIERLNKISEQVKLNEQLLKEIKKQNYEGLRILREIREMNELQGKKEDRKRIPQAEQVSKREKPIEKAPVIDIESSDSSN